MSTGTPTASTMLSAMYTSAPVRTARAMASDGRRRGLAPPRGHEDHVGEERAVPQVGYFYARELGPQGGGHRDEEVVGQGPGHLDAAEPDQDGLRLQLPDEDGDDDVRLFRADEDDVALLGLRHRPDVGAYEGIGSHAPSGYSIGPDAAR